MPKRFVDIGDSVVVDGKEYVCCEKGVTLACEACKGCDIVDLWCDNLQCSRFDRLDGKNVLFKRIEK